MLNSDSTCFENSVDSNQLASKPFIYGFGTVGAKLTVHYLFLEQVKNFFGQVTIYFSLGNFQLKKTSIGCISIVLL